MNQDPIESITIDPVLAGLRATITALDAQIKEYPEDSPERVELQMRSLRCAMAGWVLVEADVAQIKEVFYRHISQAQDGIPDSD